MKSIRIAYLGDYRGKEIIKSRNIGYSQAGNNKIEGFVECIEKTDMNVTVISPSCDKKNFKFYKLEKGKLSHSDIIYLPFMGFPYINHLSAMMFVLLYLLVMISKGKFNRILFYNHSPKFVVPLIIIRFLLNIPIYLEYEDSYFRGAKYFSKRLYGFFFETFTNKIIDGAILVNSFYINKVKTKNIVLCRGFAPKWTYKRSRRLYEDEIRVGYTGGLDDIRGIDTFVNAALEIPKLVDGMEVKFFIAGDGPLKNWMLQHIADSDNIEYLGLLSRDENAQLITNMDILVNPHKEDIKDLFPSKIFDYIASGNIIVSSNCYDISQIQYKNLYIYKDKNLTGFLHKILKEKPPVLKDEEAFIRYSVEYTANELKSMFIRDL
jgi:glycosyltransferase involved in cell wall biosynthesis